MINRRVCRPFVVFTLLYVACGGGGGSSPVAPSSTSTTATTQVTVTNLSASASTTTPNVGQTVTVIATATYSDGTSATITPTWTSSNTSVATVSTSGTVTALAAGSTTVTATAGGRSATVAITVATASSFSAGQYLVGSQVAAGRYYTVPSNGCYWERQSGFGGTLSDIVANEFVAFDAGQLIVDINETDFAFEADSDCGTWYDTARHGLQVNISPGWWLVGEQVQPGTYTANVSSGCYWERLNGFGGTLSDINANKYVSSAGSQFVSILASDEGFYTDDDCGTWTLQD